MWYSLQFCEFIHSQIPTVGVDPPRMVLCCDMRQCLVVGRPVLDEDVRLGHVALVKCEGSDGTCPRIVHPVCTLTPHMYRHCFCCRHVLHDEKGKNRLLLCDSCAESVICDRAYSFASNGRGRWV